MHDRQMTSPDPSAQPAAEMTCCGQDGTWSPKAGDPIAVSCRLCPSSPTYFRRHAGYQPVKPLGEDTNVSR
jgi:hypothetical protein